MARRRARDCHKFVESLVLRAFSFAQYSGFQQGKVNGTGFTLLRYLYAGIQCPGTRNRPTRLRRMVPPANDRRFQSARPQEIRA